MGSSVGFESCTKMQLQLLLLALVGLCSVHALRFSTPSITVDSDAIIVGRPAKLTCNYVKFRTESVRGIGWYLSYEGFRSKIFHYHVTTGRKEPSIYSHVRTMEETATEKELTIVLPEFRSPTITLGCEVEVLRDSGYGKLDHSKKITEANVSVADTQGHQLRMKNGKWDAYNSGAANHEATVGQPLLVSCISQGTTPSPNLTLFINDQAWKDVSATARTQDLSMGVPSGMKVVEGRLDMVYDSMFGRNNMMVIECKAHIQDYLLTTEHLSLRKKTNQIVYTNQGYQRPARPVQVYDREQEQPRRTTQFEENRGGRAYDDSVIHARLLDLLDPAKHMHPGIPYDFYSGYILMVAKNVDIDHEDEGAGGHRQSYHRSRSQPSVKESVHLYGRLSEDTVSDLRRNYGGFNRVSDEKYRIVMNPVDVLNLLGQHGYRVIGFTAESDQKMVWTLEQKDFEQLAESHNTIHH